MSRIADNRVVVEAVEKEAKEGFTAVEVQDDFVYKGRIVELPDGVITSFGGQTLEIGDVILFAKGSPDTHEVGKQKFILTSDILKVL